MQDVRETVPLFKAVEWSWPFYKLQLFFFFGRGALYEGVGQYLNFKLKCLDFFLTKL